jgi:hypothetical protein
MDKYAIMLLNLASTRDNCAVFLQTDEDENTLLFDTEQEAKA